MTVLVAYFKVSSQGGCNPFERQKVWGENKTLEGGEFKELTVYFTMAIATDKDSAEVMDQIWQEWGRLRGKILRRRSNPSTARQSLALWVGSVYPGNVV